MDDFSKVHTVVGKTSPKEWTKAPSNLPLGTLAKKSHPLQSDPIHNRQTDCPEEQWNLQGITPLAKLLQIFSWIDHFVNPAFCLLQKPTTMEHLLPFTTDLLTAIANGYTEDFHFLHDGSLINVKDRSTEIVHYAIDSVVSLFEMRSTLFNISTSAGIRGTAIVCWDQQ